MRVYGSSPLYNYVELVFRSKRLFIISIVLATAVTAAVAAVKSGSYRAQALVFLTGANNSGPGSMSDSQKGTIEYKLNLLSVYNRDPDFLRDAFKDANLNVAKGGKEMSTEEFDKFCRDARTALSFSTGGNILEININWPDERAAPIINAFFSKYYRDVTTDENIAALTTTKSLKERLDEYTVKQKVLELKVAGYQKAHVEHPPAEYAGTVEAYQHQKDVVAGTTNQLNTARMQLTEVVRQLDETPRTVVDNTRFVRPLRPSDPELDQLKVRRAALDTRTAELLTRYTAENPLVKKVTDERGMVDILIAEGEKKYAALPETKQQISDHREVLNPAWMRLDAARSDMEIQVQALDGQMREAMSTMEIDRQRAQLVPYQGVDYEWMTKDLALYTSIRDNLRARVEQAKMQEDQDRALHLSEMKMIVIPKSEADTVGSKNVLFYAAGPLLGLIIAFAFSLLAETLDHSLRSPLEVEKYLGMPVLAVLPRTDVPGAKVVRKLTSGDGPSSTALPPSG